MNQTIKERKKRNPGLVYNRQLLAARNTHTVLFCTCLNLIVFSCTTLTYVNAIADRLLGKSHSK